MSLVMLYALTVDVFGNISTLIVKIMFMITGHRFHNGSSQGGQRVETFITFI